MSYKSYRHVFYSPTSNHTFHAIINISEEDITYTYVGMVDHPLIKERLPFDKPLKRFMYNPSGSIYDVYYESKNTYLCLKKGNVTGPALYTFSIDDDNIEFIYEEENLNYIDEL